MGKEEAKTTFIHKQDDLLCRKSQRINKKKLLEPVNKLSKVATHKNKHKHIKNQLFLSIGKEQSEEKIKKTIPYMKKNEKLRIKSNQGYATLKTCILKLKKQG